MKNWMGIGAMLVVVAATAQPGWCRNSPLVVYLDGGISRPMGPKEFSDYRSTGWIAGAGLGYRVGSRLVVVGRVDRSGYGLDKQAVIAQTGVLPGDVTRVGGRATVWALTFGVRAGAAEGPGLLSPYMHTGLTLLKLSGRPLPPNIQSPTFDPEGLDLDDTSPGVTVGGGLDFDVGDRVDFYVETRLAIGIKEGESTRFLPVVIGLSIR